MPAAAPAVASARRRLLIAGSAAWLAAPPAQALEAGATAPALALQATDGEAVLGSARWRLVYLDFWASWCGPRRQSFPWMNELHDRHQAAGLRVVAVNLDAKLADAQVFLKQQPARFAVAYDPAGASAKLFGVKAMPSSYLLRPDRSVLLVHRGFRLEDRAELGRRIEAALG